jgi:CDP-diacylglycerol---serine O-phosphatidyltransferase
VILVFAVSSSAMVSVQTKPAFARVWLLGFYIVIGLIETLFNMVKKPEEPPSNRQSSIP